jgi:hypothetical protein
MFEVGSKRSGGELFSKILSGFVVSCVVGGLDQPRWTGEKSQAAVLGLVWRRRTGLQAALHRRRPLQSRDSKGELQARGRRSGLGVFNGRPLSQRHGLESRLDRRKNQRRDPTENVLWAHSTHSTWVLVRASEDPQCIDF